MRGRLARTEKGAATALASLVIALALCAPGVSCVSTGTSAATADGGEGGSVGDSSVGGEAAAEGSFEASPPDVSQGPDGSAAASLSASSVSVPVPCGGSATGKLTVSNSGTAPLNVSATTVGSAFSVAPATLTVAPGMSGGLVVTATVPSTATAGSDLMGSLSLFTNDPTPSKTNVSIPLSATPTGATLSFAGGAPSFAFPSTAVGTPESLTLTLQNTGNGPATFTIGAPSVSPFSFGEADAGDDAAALPTMTLSAGEMWPVSATFTPANTTAASGSATITSTGTVCAGSGAAASVTAIPFMGQGASPSQPTGWPAGNVVSFGPAACGGNEPPAEQVFTLTNPGAIPIEVTEVTLDTTTGFTTNVRAGKTIGANGGLLRITVDAPAVPATWSPPASSSTPPAISTTLSILTTADSPGMPHTLTLSETPIGAVLSFVPPANPVLGPVKVSQLATEPFSVTNTGSGPANVSLVVTWSTADDGGDAGAPSGIAEAGLDADEDGSEDGAGAPQVFSVSTPSFTIQPGVPQAETVTFQPDVALAYNASVAMVATSGLCGTLPGAVSLSGTGLGLGPVVTPSSLSFSATCGGTAPAAQTFVVSNGGSVDFTWSMAASTGPGASQYTVSASPASPPPPGVTGTVSPWLLIPGASSTVTVTPAAVPSPAPNPAPSAFAAQIAITTDVPNDPTHVVTLGVTPLGDQLSITTASPLRFGQVPINTTFGQSVAVVNGANAGSPAASLAFALAGTGASGYGTLAPIASLAAGASGSDNLQFAPTSAVPYPATLSITTTDSLCTALPSPLQLSGTGTDGQVALSATTIAFGTNASDPSGFVDCGATGLTQTLTVSNVGNQILQITGLSLGKTTSPFSLPAALVASLPITIAIGGSASIAVTPSPIPQTITTDPNDPTTYADVLTVTTDAAGDAPHAVNLVMQARGAVIANTPLSTTWSFGTITAGSIQTFTSAIQNTGNASVSILLQGVLQPTIFGLQNSPTTAAGATTLGGNVVTAIAGQFTPRASNGSWSDSGTLVVTAPQAFCSPLPAQWLNPTITLLGATNSNPPLTTQGSLAFPTTDCGDAAPAGQSITITNATNVAYAYSVAFSTGTYYKLTATSGPALDGGLGVDAGGPDTIPPYGTATILVTPTTIVPGAGVLAGSAPYGDNLIVTVATSPPTQWSFPISWTLNGAVLSLPKGNGPYTADGTGAYTLPCPSPQGSASCAYVADSSGAYALPMVNTGTSPASVSFSIAPFGDLRFSPVPPISVSPGIGATPGLVSTSADAQCKSSNEGDGGEDGSAPPGAATTVTAAFLYSGPVCQPFPVSAVTVQACFGTFE